MRDCRAIAIMALVLMGVGCSPPKAPTRTDRAKEVLAADPSFTTVLEKHKTLSSRIETYERELELKRTTVEQNIAKMREDLATVTESVRHKVAETKKLMLPEQQRLALDVSMAKEELNRKRFQRMSVGRSLAKLRKAIKLTAATATPDDRTRQEAQLQEMAADVQRLDQEIAALRAHMKILQIKSRLIEF